MPVMVIYSMVVEPSINSRSVPLRNRVPGDVRPHIHRTFGSVILTTRQEASDDTQRRGNFEY